MQPCVKNLDASTEIYIDEGCYITELSNSKDDPELSIARARVKPGVTTKLHKLRNTIERYVILEGEGVVELGDGLVEKLHKHDVVIIPSNCPQKITNSGELDLVFLVVCSPRFVIDHYVEI